MKLKKIAVLLLAAALLLAGCSAGEPNETTVAPTDEVTESTEPTEAAAAAGYGENDVTALDDYSVAEASPDDATMLTNVAVDADGNELLTNSELQYWYWLEFYNFMNSYQAYVSYFGLDVTKPLSTQQSLGEGKTWEQYFLEGAATRFQQYYALAKLAEADGFTLSEEEEAQLADITDPDGEFAAQYKASGFADADAYLQENFGKGVSAEHYVDYLRIYYIAYSYSSQLEEAYTATLTDADVEAEFDANGEEGALKMNNINVRHILIKPEKVDDEHDADSDEAWAAAEQKANEVYAMWQTNPTVDYFTELCAEYSADGTKDTGGLYEDVAPGKMVTEFNDWCFDPARQPGDSGIVKTQFGYHIMYFVGQAESRAWYDDTLSSMVQTYLTGIINDAVSTYPVRFDYTKIRLYDLITEANTQAATEEAVG